MDLQTYLAHLNAGKPVVGGSAVHQFMHGVSQDAIRITMEINSSYHTPEELRTLFSHLIGKPVDDGFGLFPPFYTDCGKNISLGKDIPAFTIVGGVPARVIRELTEEERQ